MDDADLKKILKELRKQGRTLMGIDKRIKALEANVDLVGQACAQSNQRMTILEELTERGSRPAIAGSKSGRGLYFAQFFRRQRRVDSSSECRIVAESNAEA